MREIKFRGKSLVTGDWVYGGYYSQPDRRKDILRHIIVYKNNDSGQQTIHEPIDIKTLGQYTGYKSYSDRKEIYEGDIVKITAIALHEEDVYDSKTGEYLGKETIEEKKEEIKLVKWQDDGFNLIRNNWIKWHFEILGNKWDNPGLLKEELK
ncbi:MAG: YopX domain-containing protein [Thermoanaerobacterium thermosaccharolyticum]